LIDTGADLCVFPRHRIPQRREPENVHTLVADGTLTPTCGLMCLILDLGLRQEFSCWFVMAYVVLPVSGADFLSIHGLLVDSRNKRLLAGAPAQAASSRIPIFSFLYFYLISPFICNLCRYIQQML
jgi:hypothetical protein